MKMRVLAVGRLRGTIAPAVREYEERAGHYWNLDILQIDAGISSGAASEARVRAAEGERLRERLPSRGDVWVLTREGKGLSSTDLARTLGDRALEGGPGITFVLGGAYGLEPDLVRGAARRLSLSPMTLPHQIARLLLAEQLYRAGTILRNEPYHKGGT